MSTEYAKEIRLFDLGDHFKDSYHELRRTLREEKLHINTRRSLADLAAQSLAVFALFGSLLFIAHQTFLGIITVGSLVMYFGAFPAGPELSAKYAAEPGRPLRGQPLPH